MRKYAAFSFSAAVILLAALPACDKAVMYNGNVHITILYNQNPLAGYKVYYRKSGLQEDSQEKFLNDGMQTTDEAGKATFYQLPPPGGQLHFLHCWLFTGSGQDRQQRH